MKRVFVITAVAVISFFTLSATWGQPYSFEDELAELARSMSRLVESIEQASCTASQQRRTQ